MLRYLFWLLATLGLVLVTCPIVVFSQSTYWDTSGTWHYEATKDLYDEAKASFNFGQQIWKVNLHDMYNREEIIEYRWDTLRYALAFIHHFQPIYQHSQVPFSYVPYNYRDSYIRLQTTSNRFAEVKTDIQGIRREPRFWYGEDFLLEGIYYNSGRLPEMAGYFLGGSFRYTTRLGEKSVSTLDYFRMTIRGRGGYFTSQMLVGIEVGGEIFSDAQNGEGRWLEAYYWDSYQVRAYGEYNPVPNSRLSAALTYHIAPEPQPDFHEWTIPVEFSYLLISSWTEFRANTSWSKNNGVFERRIWRIGGGIRQYVGDHNVELSFENWDVNVEDLGDFSNFTIVFLSGNFVVKRFLMIEPSVGYGWGNQPADVDLKIPRYSLNITALF